jgi:Cof subfamily protein (haloacid dehalogenase superfamily)
MIKLIVTDVDGTLLDNNSKLSELNRKALFECKKRDIEIILATGKSISAVKPLIQILGLGLPQITLTGAVIVDKYFKIVNAIRISQADYFTLIKEIKGKGYKPLVAIAEGEIFYDDYDPNFIVFDKINEPIYKVDHLENEYYSKNCVSVSIAIKESDPLDKYLRDKFSSKLRLCRAGEYFFDIMSLEASKGNALNFILNKLDFRKDEIAIFGDSPNDLSMFNYGKLRFAVKNSYQEVLNNADVIIDENHLSGLGKAVYKYILNIKQ